MPSPDDRVLLSGWLVIGVLVALVMARWADAMPVTILTDDHLALVLPGDADDYGDCAIYDTGGCL